MNEKKKILFSGGGTAGSVTPLLALAETLQTDSNSLGFSFFWLGTKTGPEKKLVLPQKIEFQAIAGGKWRRYFSVKNFFDLFKIIIGFCQSWRWLKKWRPDLVISAGSFVSVPVVWAAWGQRRPVLIHQQDIRPGLANRLMAPTAKIITVTFQKSLNDYGAKARWTGNPIREEFLRFKITAREARQKLNLAADRPTVLIMGGGTGALAINKLTLSSLPALTKFCQIIHITGPGKSEEKKLSEQEARFYRPFSFLNIDGLIKAYAASDLVVCRAGLGSITELSYLGKPTVLIPMPDSHQEDNAAFLADKEAAVVLKQKGLTLEKFIKIIRELLKNKEKRERLGANIKKIMPPKANQKLREIIFDLL